MQPTEFFQSKTKHTSLFVACIVLAILCIFFTVTQKRPLRGIDALEIIVFLALIAVLIIKTIKKRHNSNRVLKRVFAISDEGIEIDSLNNLIVPWTAINTVRLQCIDSLYRRGRSMQDWYLAIRINDTAFLEQRSATSTRLRSFKKKKAYRIQLFFMEMKPEEIYALCTPYIKAHCPNQTWQEYRIEYDAEFWPMI